MNIIEGTSRVLKVDPCNFRVQAQLLLALSHPDPKHLSPLSPLSTMTAAIFQRHTRAFLYVIRRLRELPLREYVDDRTFP